MPRRALRQTQDVRRCGHAESPRRAGCASSVSAGGRADPPPQPACGRGSPRVRVAPGDAPAPCGDGRIMTTSARIRVRRVRAVAGAARSRCASPPRVVGADRAGGRPGRSARSRRTARSVSPAGDWLWPVQPFRLERPFVAPPHRVRRRPPRDRPARAGRATWCARPPTASSRSRGGRRTRHPHDRPRRRARHDARAGRLGARRRARRRRGRRGRATCPLGGHTAPGALHFGVRLRRRVHQPAAAPRRRPARGAAALLLSRRGRVRGSGARMREPVGRGQPLARDVRVDLRRAEARVAEDLLDGAKIGAAVEQVRRRGVAQRVRSDVRRRATGPSCARDEVVRRARPEAPAARSEEDAPMRRRRRRPPGEERRSAAHQVGVDGAQAPGPRTARPAPSSPFRARARCAGRGRGRRRPARTAPTRAAPRRRAARASRDRAARADRPLRPPPRAARARRASASAVATFGSVRPRLGATSRRLGSRRRRPRSRSPTRRSRARRPCGARCVDAASPRCAACHSHSRRCSRSTSASVDVAARRARVRRGRSGTPAPWPARAGARRSRCAAYASAASSDPHGSSMPRAPRRRGLRRTALGAPSRRRPSSPRQPPPPSQPPARRRSARPRPRGAAARESPRRHRRAMPARRARSVGSRARRACSAHRGTRVASSVRGRGRRGGHGHRCRGIRARAARARRRRS